MEICQFVRVASESKKKKQQNKKEEENHIGIEGIPSKWIWTREVCEKSSVCPWKYQEELWWELKCEIPRKIGF